MLNSHIYSDQAETLLTSTLQYLKLRFASHVLRRRPTIDMQTQHRRDDGEAAKNWTIESTVKFIFPPTQRRKMRIRIHDGMR